MAVEPDFEYDLLKRLTEARGVPGYEERVREIIREKLTSPVDKTPYTVLDLPVYTK